MSEYKSIITVNDENNSCLFERCDEIDVIKEGQLLRQIVGELKKRIRADGLVALSAPAIGYNKRIFCVNFSDSEIKTFINPILSQVKGLGLSRERCTSIPGKEFIRPRNTDITIMYQKPLGQIESRQIIGMAAQVVQHELDHLEGILLSDIGFEIGPEYDSFTDEQKEELITLYLDSLDLKKKQIQENLDSEEDTKRISDGIRFLEGVAKGDIEMDKETFAEDS